MRDVILTYRLTKYYGRMLADKPLDRVVHMFILADVNSQDSLHGYYG
jgi:hypothetical protein